MMPCDEDERNKLEHAMSFIGVYMAAASAVCTLAMAADAFNGFRHKKLWFPCHYFSLNSTSLTLLGVAMKLAMDLTSIMRKIRVAKFTSLIFMTTSIGHFMSSLGSMNDKHILGNVVALAILVFTVIVDVLIRFHVNFVPLYIAPMILMLLSLATLVSLAITVPATKRLLETTYQEKHKTALWEEGKLKRREAWKIDERKRHMMKYWVMAATSSPQFVIARSAVCTSSAFICLFALITIPIAHIKHKVLDSAAYGTSIQWIMSIQTVGVAISSIAPMLRWFVVVSFNRYKTNTNRLKDEFKIEPYWTQTLEELRDELLDLQIGRGKFTKYLHKTERFAFSICIRLQKLIVRLSKLFVFISALLTRPIFLCFTHTNKLMKQQSSNTCNILRQFGPYVLRLEGEAELPTTILKNICSEADSTIQMGRSQQSRHLISLVSKFVNFKGVVQFDSNQIPSLYSQDPPNCWTLPIVTLTSIAVGIPNIAEKKRKHLLSGVSEGLALAKLVQETLIKDDGLANVREAADMCWGEVVLYKRWQDINLERAWGNWKEMVQELAQRSERMVVDYLDGAAEKNPLYWQAKTIAANSMYRISRSVELSIDGAGDEGAFEEVSVMIAEIAAACFTNLPNVITTLCQRNAIEKREEMVRKAFLLLGRTEKIVEAVGQKEWPSMEDKPAADIEEWRRDLGSISFDETVVTTV